MLEHICCWAAASAAEAVAAAAAAEAGLQAELLAAAGRQAAAPRAGHCCSGSAAAAGGASGSAVTYTELLCSSIWCSRKTCDTSVVFAAAGLTNSSYHSTTSDWYPRQSTHYG
jgi:hypothetical protein